MIDLIDQLDGHIWQAMATIDDLDDALGDPDDKRYFKLLRDSLQQHRTWIDHIRFRLEEQ